MRADRLISMVMLLQTGGKMTAATIADELGVSRRTILRDVDALSSAGIPIYTESRHGGGIALDENYRTTLTGLTEAEIHTLFISGNAQLLERVGMGAAVESAQRKLSAALPLRHQPMVEQIRQRLYIDPLWWWYDTQRMPFWDALQAAVYDDRVIEVLYEHYDGEIVTRVIEPYSLVSKSSMWYLIARRDGEFRTYRVSRFHAVTPLDEHFLRADEFDLPTYWQAHLDSFSQSMSPYACTLRIHPDRIRFAQWLVPGRTEIIDDSAEDGWVTARFQLESLELAKMLVFGLGTQCVVLEPEALYETVITAARELLEQANTLS